jgi:NhaP-type Na+/H+ and K+/H+ antiporter
MSLLVTRIATTALTLTGLSREAAKFQARSAFTGTGFTTGEAEKVVRHPVRRQIVTVLMVTRSAGLVTIVISLILSFGGRGDESQVLVRLAWLLAGIFVLWFAASSRYIDRYLTHVIERALRRWTELDTRDYQSLLRLSGDYAVKEMAVSEGHWLADKTLRDIRLPEEGVMVLGIYRDSGDYVGAPRAETRIYPGDLLILYGRSEGLHELDQRREDTEGEAAHARAVSKQRRHMAQQEAKEAAHGNKRRGNGGPAAG